MTNPGDDEPVAVRRSRMRPVAWGALLLLLLAMAIGWTQRRQIATHYIDQELVRRGVAARYKVAQIGPRTQRLEDLVIGDPARPDLTADWVEIETAIGFSGATVRLIRARGVRIYGRIENGRLKLGEIDKLLPAPSGTPFRLPDIAVDVADTAMRLDTPAGRVGLSLAGHGNLAAGFDGRVAAISTALRFGDCRIDRAVSVLTVKVTARKPSLQGPLRASNLSCPGVGMIRPQTLVQATLGEALDRWRGNARLNVPQLRAGDGRIANLRGNVAFDGNMALTKGTADLDGDSAGFGDHRSGPASFRGRYAFSPDAGGFSLRGDAGAKGVMLASEILQSATAPLAGAAATPVGPIADALADAVRRAGRKLDVEGSLAFVSAGGGAVRIESLNSVSASGARLTIGGGEGLTYYAGRGTMRFDGDIGLSGGGFPFAQIALRQTSPDGVRRGTAKIAPMIAGNARLALAPIRFSAAGGVTRIDTAARLSGPISDGYVRDLLVPISGTLGAGGFAFGQACTSVQFASLDLSSLELGPTRLPLCPTGRALVYSRGGRVGGGASIASPRLAGRLGESNIAINADRLRFDLGGADFTASNLAVRLASANGPHRLDMSQLTGDLGKAGVAGRFSGASAKVANVPLLVSDGAGQWRFAGGRLALDGGLTVADAVDPARFYPLASRDFRLTLAGNAIDAGGTLIDPKTGTRIAVAKIDHSLNSGRGNAVLDVPGITFGPAYQPEQLTRLTVGVVALVNGTVSGGGQIHWSPDGVTSSGTFTTPDTDLAAAFGPVEGLATTIHFTDLLGLVTAPSQVATTKLIRAGIDVYDGEIRYQLLPELRVKVESGQWPFAGGELLLEETILDFNKPSAKNLTFRITGLDGARFIQQMEFDNIAATGLFDGVVPMIFDENGGRIVGGHLAARPAGGTLSYIGELTDKDLGAYGKLAFDALKSLSYDKFLIDLDGSLDGEFLTRIQLDGIARDIAAAPPPGGGLRAMLVRRVLGQVAKIPFEFNINIRGPFRTLLATARSLEDPTLLIQQALPPELQGKPLTTNVQPKESEHVQ